jgi:hypothetical protein
MTEREKIELIEAYLRGDLAEAQRATVEKLLRDESFQKAVEEQREIREALGSSKVNAFRRIVREVVEERRPEVKKPPILSRRLLVSAAGIVVLLVAAWWIFKPGLSLEEKLFARYFEPTAVVGIFRNADIPAEGGDEMLQIQKEIDSLYRRQDYGQALSRMETYGAQFPDVRSSDYYYWSGLLYLFTDQPEKALMAFDSIQIGYPFEKAWYTGLAWLKAGDRRQAEAVFSDIARSESPYREEAEEILEGLKDWRIEGLKD